MFKFKFKAVLEYRAFLEDQKKMLLAEKQRIYLEEKKRGELLRQRRLEYHAAMREETQKRKIVVERLSTFQNYIIVIENQIIIQEDRTKRALMEMQEAQIELIEARKQTEVMIRAKENAYKKYQHEEDVKQQKMLDEISSIRYIRDKRNMDSTTANAVGI